MAVYKDYKLELVQVLFRHGARTCSRSEATVPMPQYVDQAFHDNYGYEQLTNIGKAQVHKLGCALRERYNDFLGDYHPHDVYAYSSNSDRTKMSLQLVLAGLYPPAPEQTWHSELKWMPVPTHTVPGEIDLLLQAFSKPKFMELLKEAKSAPEYLELTSKLWKLNEFFEDKGITALSHYGFFGCMGIFNVLNAHKASKAVLPDWYSDEVYNTLKEHLEIYFDYMVSSKEMKKHLIGPLIKRFIENMNINDNKTNPRKIYLYSGHELNIAAFTRAHDIGEFKYPDFGSAIILEKWRDSQNKLHVRKVAWTGYDDRFITLKLGNHEEFCPIEDYLKIVKHVTPTNEEINSMLSNVNFDLNTICDRVHELEYSRPHL